MIEITKHLLPLPDETLIEKEEYMWKIKLPSDYRNFLMKSNGGTPNKQEFKYNNHVYMVKSFLCILHDSENSEYGFYDIDVVLTQIEDRLTSNEDLIGCELLPIAELFAGDYLCLDYSNNKDNPTICIWNHEESGELEPVTYFVANSFSEFISLLY